MNQKNPDPILYPISINMKPKEVKHFAQYYSKILTEP